jgi:pilus assembly protein Flp/PilA
MGNRCPPAHPGGFFFGFLSIDLIWLKFLAARVEALRLNRGLDMSNLFARFLTDESGATAIEYGLIAAGISLAIIAGVNGIGTNLSTKFGAINTSLK